MYQSTSIAPLISEAGLIPVRIMLNYCQRKYAYHLFLLPDRHLTKDVPPISLKMGDRSAQPGELPENDKIWSFNQKIRTYNQRLTRQISVSFSIDLAKAIESLIHLKPAEFVGEIIIQDPKIAIKEAQEDMSDLTL